MHKVNLCSTPSHTKLLWHVSVASHGSDVAFFADPQFGRRYGLHEHTSITFSPSPHNPFVSSHLLPNAAVPHTQYHASFTTRGLRRPPLPNKTALRGCRSQEGPVIIGFGFWHLQNTSQSLFFFSSSSSFFLLSNYSY